MIPQKNNFKFISPIIFGLILCLSFFFFNNYYNFKAQSSQNVPIVIKSKRSNHFAKGTVIIPSVNIKEDLYSKPTKYNLSKGIIQQYSDQYPGIKANYILAGHNLVYSKRFFTNLKNVHPSDKIIVQNKFVKATYTTVKVCYINTCNLKYLKKRSKKPTITLYTCTDDNNQQKRLIVYGKLSHAKIKNK